SDLHFQQIGGHVVYHDVPSDPEVSPVQQHADLAARGQDGAPHAHAARGPVILGLHVSAFAHAGRTAVLHTADVGLGAAGLDGAVVVHDAPLKLDARAGGKRQAAAHVRVPVRAQLGPA